MEGAKPRFYGRRRGRTLRTSRQTLLAEELPRWRIDAPLPPLETLFGPGVTSFGLEIGFGSGEHLLWRAERTPQRGYIGCEVFINGIAALLAGLAQKRLANIRLFTEDARLLLPLLPPGRLAEIFILFPDPWPKYRHRDRRFVNPREIAQLARVLQPGGLLTIATDDPIAMTWVLAQMRAASDFRWCAERPGDWQSRDWPATRYERKAITGFPPLYLSYRRIDPLAG